MNSQTKQLLMLFLAAVLIFYKPSSYLESGFIILVAIAILVMAVSEIREHRKTKKNKKDD